jgi:ferric-dicitrate binding protein FerR (iron transport regulator)
MLLLSVTNFEPQKQTKKTLSIDMNHFDELKKRYLEGVASDKERSELIRMVRTGEYDHRFGPDFTEELEALFQKQDPPEVVTIRDRIFETRIKPRLPEGLRMAGSRVWLLAAAITGALALASGVCYMSLTRWGNQETAQQSVTPHTFNGPDYITLPDGSRVYLNSGSTLRYADSFGTGSREVALTGEAYFDVQYDPSNPFIVHTGKVNTKVLGTAFNIKEAPSGEVKVTVTRGLVEVSDATRVYSQLTVDEQITVNTATDQFVTEKINATEAVVWKDQYLILEDVTMREAASLIGERFGVTVTIESKNLEPCQVTSMFLNGEGLEQVLVVLSELTKATYKVQGNNVTFEGGTCD